MKELAIQIVRCLDDQHQPGWVECDFIDADGRRHVLVDKIPISRWIFLTARASTHGQQE
jgi:hypothetical protein